MSSQLLGHVRHCLYCYLRLNSASSDRHQTAGNSAAELQKRLPDGAGAAVAAADIVDDAHGVFVAAEDDGDAGVDGEASSARTETAAYVPSHSRAMSSRRSGRGWQLMTLRTGDGACRRRKDCLTCA